MNLFLSTSVAALASLAAFAPNAPSTPSQSTCVLATQPDKTIVDTAVAAGSFKTLAAALQAGDLIGALQGEGPFTVFAPTDEAFAKLPKATLQALLDPANKKQLVAILTYHVVPGAVNAAAVARIDGATTLNGQRVDVHVDEGQVRIDGANVVRPDIACSNGVIHAVDSVLMPSTDDIVQTAKKAGTFRTLAAALGAAELASVLQGEGPFTVFAPTDEAFAKLPKGTVEALLLPENRKQLEAVLTYHVVVGRVYATDAAKAMDAKTVQGSSVHFAHRENALFVDGARITGRDLDASNGVIHVIDSVLMPK